jgi:GNAT superfamily N-acetyltransferase
MTPVIRNATPDDAEELARLRWQLYTEQDPSIAEPFDAYRKRFLGFALAALVDDRWRAWVAGTEAGLAAAMWLQTVPRVPAPGRGKPRPIGYLTNAYVEPAHRGLGLGSAMLAAVFAHCEANGFELVVAWPAKDAYSFYERAGFTRPPDPVVRHLPR